LLHMVEKRFLFCATLRPLRASKMG